MKCPKCGSDHVITTLMGSIGLDMNKVYCHGPGCDKTGVAWQWQDVDEIAKYLKSQYDRGLLNEESMTRQLKTYQEWRRDGSIKADYSHDL